MANHKDVLSASPIGARGGLCTDSIAVPEIKPERPVLTNEPPAPHNGGEMGARVRSFPWETTSLGSMETWSPALKTMLRIMLANRFPHILWWGPDFIQFYNDPYIPVLGAKHPGKALGQPARQCWAEIWHVIHPLIDRPFQGGPATWDDDIFLEIHRHGFIEECHFTIAYSPVPDEAVPTGIGGVLATVHEITGKVVGDRRVLVLRDLGAQAAEARTAEDACALAAHTLAMHPKDIPFALLYLVDPDRARARLAGTSGIMPGGTASPQFIELTPRHDSDPIWPLAQVLRSETIQLVPNLAKRFTGEVPAGPWSDPPHMAVVVPIHSNRAHHLAGFLVAGISSRLAWDDAYRDFLDLVGSQVATAIANAREYEAEKQRAEALAEIDRAKTAFFSNVSHEFRTPLTLMLGPVEELLAKSHTDLPPAAKGQLEVVNRNGLRLLRLVNSILDFSRIEAGRVQAVFEPTDLGPFTAELVSNFRAATERAGLKLMVNCPSLSAPVYVDRDMWEKVVLNLVSNAFKFTFEGEIEVALQAKDGMVELRVRDTGVGIPVEEMPRLFERFHRVPNTRSRTFEGSGIGLALVRELIKLHGGTVRAESQLAAGSTFVITVPLGKAHLPPERVGGTRSLAPTAIGAAPFVEEALRWLPEEPARKESMETVPERELIPVPCPAGTPPGSHPRLIVADDNADMRQYLTRLLAERYIVQALPNGQAALAAAREHRPDLILSDVMMPQLDGIGLVREVRADDRLKTVPIILLSARAGEEARVEGLQHGADDYLIKPFSARELLARVEAHLEMARLRKEAADQVRQTEERFRAWVTATSDLVYIMSPDWSEMLYLRGREILTDTPAPERTWLEKYILPEDQPEVLRAINNAILNKSVFELEHRVKRADGTAGWIFSRAVPLLDPEGKVREWFGAASDITKRKQTEAALRASEARYRLIVDTAYEGVVMTTPDGRYTYVNQRMADMLGYQVDEIIGKTANDFAFDGAVSPVQPSSAVPHVNGATHGEIKFRRRDGSLLCTAYNTTAIFDDAGRHVANIGMHTDITERKHAEAGLRERDQRFITLLENLETGVALVDDQRQFVLYNRAFLRIFGLPPEVANIKHQDWSRWQVFDEFGARLPFDEHPIRKASFTGRPVRNQLIRINRPSDHQDVWLLISAEPILKPNGQLHQLICTYYDITDRRRAEEALRARERELEEAQRLARVGSWEWDSRLDRVRWSKQLYRLLLLDESAPAPKYPEQVSFYTPESRRRLDQAVEKTFRDGTSYELDIEMVRTDGNRFWVTARGEPVHDNAGELVGLRGTVVDITDRKRAEEAVRESRERLRLAMRAARLYAFEWDLLTDVVRREGDAAGVLGVTFSEETAKTFFARVHAEDRQKLMELTKALKPGRDSYTAEFRVVRPDGGEVVLEESSRGVFDQEGRLVRVIGMVADITERRAAEKALHESERNAHERAEVLEKVLDGVPTPVFIVHDPRGSHITGNRAANELLRMPSGGEVSFSAPLELRPRHFKAYKDGRELAIHELPAQRAARGEPVRDFEFTLVFDDGTRREVAGHGTPLLDEQDQPRGAVYILLDITQRKAFQAELERLVDERTAKLHELVGELEHFSYTITHDLKSPLRAMRGFSEMAGLLCEENKGNEAKEFLERISTAAERMDRLITDALNYSRTVRQELPLEDVDAGALLRGMLDSYPELQPERAHTIVEGRLPEVLANEAGLTQVFSNLLGNAVKFVKRGARPEIRIWANEHNGWVRIWVEDHGIGISKQMLPRVFDMFSRGSKSYEGTGIGLALVRKVVQRMGGRVGVESEEGSGSRFWFELRPAQAIAGLRRIPVAPTASMTGGPVLYVEDEESDAMFMTMAFSEKGLGANLHIVTDGRAAIDYLSGAGKYADREKFPVPALLLLDLNLPQVPGFGVLEWMRNHPDYRRTPVVIFSSSTREEDRAKAKQLGANDFVPKPGSGVKFGEVVDAVRRKWLP